MMMLLRTLGIVIYSVCFALAVKQRYDGYSVLRIQPNSNTALEYVKSLEHLLVSSEFWREGSGIDLSVDLMVGAGADRLLAEKKLGDAGIQFEVMIENVQQLIDDEQMQIEQTRSVGGRAMNLESFNTHDNILAWLDEMAAAFPNLAKVESIGNTYENREMKLIKIGTNTNNPAIWIDGGIHAREWISPATVIWFINKLLTEYDTASEIKQLVDSLNWYILPVHNPDGYEFSRTNTRLWRKTRSPTPDSSFFGGRCYGVDPNRNWDVGFGTTGISTNGCSDIYCGTTAHSEPCVKNVVDYMTSHKDELKIYVSFHSYSQLWLTPYSYSYDRPSDYDELYSLAGTACRALTSVYGTTYRYGQVPYLLYTASGSSMDWAYDKAGIKYSFTVELRDTGRYGFVPPASEIRPSGEETWAGLLALINEILPSLH